MRHNRGALLAWIVAGIPLLLSSLQAIVVGAVGTDPAAGLLAVPGFYGAAVATESGGVAVSALCLLGTVGWLGLGIALFEREKRRLGTAFGAATGVVVVLLFGWLAVSAITSGAIASLLSTVIVSAVTLGGVAGTLVLSSERPESDGDSSGYGTDRDDAAETDRGRSSETDADTPTAGDPPVDEATLERIEGVAPDAVRHARESAAKGGEAVEAELYRGIETALADGWFDMSVVSTYGQQYEIVNLPSRFRELDLPTVGGRCHVGELERHVREWVDDEGISIRDIAFAIEAIDEHRSDIERHVRQREEEFDGILEDIDEDLESIRTVTDELDGTVGERTRMLVVENRHSEFDGAGAIENEIAEAKSDLHGCAFTEATERLRELRSESEALLTAVDFLRSLVGGIEHGQRSARIPNEFAEQLYVELDPLLEQQYGVTLSVQDGRILIENGGNGSGDHRSETSETSPEGGADRTETGDRSPPSTVEPEAIADEILYILRELNRTQSGGNIVEYQTESLPDGIADPSVLETLATFCRRQSDLVEGVTLQENAPPGFFEIRFADGTAADHGIDELIDRFLDRYSNDR